METLWLKAMEMVTPSTPSYGKPKQLIMSGMITVDIDYNGDQHRVDGLVGIV